MAKKKSGIRSFGGKKGKNNESLQKQTNYKIYSGISNNLVNNVSRAYGRDAFSDEPIIEICRMLNNNDPEEFFISADFDAIVIEQKWLDSGSPAIFPESSMLIKKLFDANFNFDSSVKLNLPRETFMMAMPRDFKVDGEVIPGFLVNIQRKDDFIEDYVVPMIMKVDENHNGEAVEEVRLRKNGEVTIDLIYIEPKNRDGNIHLRINEKVLSNVLKLQKMSEFEDYLESEMDRNYDDADFMRNKDMTEKDAAIQFTMLKTLAVTSVYLAATNNDKLKEGLPGRHFSSFLGTDIAMRPKTILDINETQMITKLRSNPDSHYRKFHFRNLKHESFYKNEHKDKEVGSRWVFVKDSVVNQKLDADTMTI